MKRLRSGGLLSGCLLHYLRSEHVSRGQSRGRRSLFPMKWTLFFLFPFMAKKIGQGFGTNRCQLGNYRDEGDRSRGGGKGIGGQRGLNREEKPSD